MENKVTKVAFSYCHVDEDLRNELEKHLAPLKRQGLIESWHDRRIVPGQELNGEIDQHFADADIVLLLISPDFINSNYCYDVEMRQAIERHNKDEACVIPVILRLCHWQDLPFGKLLAATPDGKPVVQYPSLDEGFYQVVTGIKKAIGNLRTARTPSQIAQRVTSFPVQAVSADAVLRSSNLRIQKSFSDHDRDVAKTECFEFIARYFTNSLDELKSRNHGIDISFQRVDAKSFEANIYVGGNRKCSCGIRIGSNYFGGDIAFSHGGLTDGSFNESVSIEDDGYVLGFRPLGMASYGQGERKFLNSEGVAEHFWAMFIESLQR
jgi:hypothetical protein